MRLNFEFSEQQVSDLKALQVKTGSVTMKDLFNNALSVFEWTVDETGKGNEIASVNQTDKNFRVLVAPPLQRVARQAAEQALVGKISAAASYNGSHPVAAAAQVEHETAKA
jgi:hypothetical protein